MKIPLIGEEGVGIGGDFDIEKGVDRGKKLGGFFYVVGFTEF